MLILSISGIYARLWQYTILQIYKAVYIKFRYQIDPQLDAYLVLIYKQCVGIFFARPVYSIQIKQMLQTHIVSMVCRCTNLNRFYLIWLKVFL